MREALLSLLAMKPSHGYELKQEFERRFGVASAPLNIGQVYVTLQRLEKDGLISSDAVEQADRPNKRVYRVTDAGRTALAEWFAGPAPAPRLRDDFVTRLLLARETGFADPFELINRQRATYLRTLRQLGDLPRESPQPAMAALLVEGASLHLEADLKWLDRCEEGLQRGDF